MNNPAFDQAFEEFVEMRKEIQQPLTASLKHHYKESLQARYAAEEWIPILKQSTTHKWRELYPIISEGHSVHNCGIRLTALREKRDLSPDQVASVMGITTTALEAYETGTRIPRDDIKILFAEYYGVPVQEIFYPEKIETPAPDVKSPVDAAAALNVVAEIALTLKGLLDVAYHYEDEGMNAAAIEVGYLLSVDLCRKLSFLTDSI